MMIRILVGVGLWSVFLSTLNTSALTPPSGTADWETQKLEMQKKSSEMRQLKYAELKQKGLDVSLLTATILDASLTDEGKFWEVVRAIMLPAEIKANTEFLEKLKSQGVDTSSFTPEIIANSAKFWELVKSVSRPLVPQSVPTPTLSGSVDITQRKQMVEYMRQKGIDVSGFTDAVISDPGQFAKLVELIKKNPPPLPNAPLSMGIKDNPLFSEKNPPKNNPLAQRENMGWQQGSTDIRVLPTVNKITDTPRPALSEKTRRDFIARLDKIPEANRQAVLEKLKTNIETQLSKVSEKQKSSLTARKLRELLMIVDDRLDVLSDDASLLESLFR